MAVLLISKGGAGGETRTRMGESPEDFESSASTNFTTPAQITLYYLKLERMSTEKMPSLNFFFICVLKKKNGVS